DADDVIDAILAGGAQAVDVRSADQDCPGTERNRLDDVAAPADAAVQENFGLVPAVVHDLGQHLDGGRRIVKLAAAVVGDDEAVDAVIEGDLDVSGRCD